ncbi:MAG: hypothetical protein KDD53_02540, partial [Bdellovibrionales bacterium]|nr:hypothetical protein [Bdellovibrionales bacterium]
RSLNVFRMLANKTAPIEPPDFAAAFSYKISSIVYAPTPGIESSPIVVQSDEKKFYTFYPNAPIFFYGKQLSSLVLSPNGVAYSKSTPKSYDFQNQATAPKDSLAVLHTDLKASKDPYGVRVKELSDRVIVQWKMQSFSNGVSGTVTAQMEMMRDGVIDMYYDFSNQELENFLKNKYTIGLRGSGLGQIDTYGSNDGKLFSKLALRFTPEKKASAKLITFTGRNVFRQGKARRLQVAGSKDLAVSLVAEVNSMTCSISDLQLDSNGSGQIKIRMPSRPRLSGEFLIKGHGADGSLGMFSAKIRPNKSLNKSSRARSTPTSKVSKRFFERWCTKTALRSKQVGSIK